MKSKYNRRLIKLKIFAPVAVGIAVSVFVITYQSILASKNTIFEAAERSLQLETQTISGIFVREKTLKTEKVKENLKVFHDYFHSQKLTFSPKTYLQKVKNQETGLEHYEQLYFWYLSNTNIINNFSAVDKIQKLTGCTATIFEKTDSGFVRISTNVRNSDSSRAVNTFIPKNSKVFQTVNSGKKFFGRAFVVNDWYITAYEPIWGSSEIIGMLYVGVKEKNLSEFEKIINSLNIKSTGEIFVLNEFGKIIIKSAEAGNFGMEKSVVDTILKLKNGCIRYSGRSSNHRKITSFTYFKDYNLYIAASVDESAETAAMVRNIILRSVILGILIFIFLSIFVYFFTTKKLVIYLKEIARFNKKLISAREALEESENKFRLLFDNSGDEIYVCDFDGYFSEMNKQACESLGYTREELLKMRFQDIKTPSYRQDVSENIKIVKEKGFFTHDTEHLAKDGSVISYEMKSRIFEFSGKEMIISIARNITERKALEKKLVSAIIETEERERKRFAVDLHDDLGPILSTAKLYSDLLKKGDFNKIGSSEIAQNIDELVDEAISTTKRISKNIMPGILHDFGLAAAINEFVSFVQNTKSVDIQINTDYYSRQKRDYIETILFQSIKELINNTVKHSEAKKITVELKTKNNLIILYYRDDGIGFDFENMLRSEKGMGLNNIVNKIKTIHGICDFNSEPGNGMFVLISIKED
jgi:PAS domain S-box-containing protein